MRKSLHEKSTSAIPVVSQVSHWNVSSFRQRSDLFGLLSWPKRLRTVRADEEAARERGPELKIQW